MSKDKDKKKTELQQKQIRATNEKQKNKPAELSDVNLDKVAGGLVLAGETLADVLAREAGRTFVDPNSGQDTTLRGSYAAAGADTSGTGTKRHKK